MDSYNNPALAEIAASINRGLESQCKLAVGKIVQHPEHGRVIITEGTFLSGGRVSNFWYWRRVDKDDKPYGETYHGYGWM